LKKFKRILVTSALPYANGPIHLGHLAGAYLPADIFVRYHRLCGHDIIFICGSDEHGVPIMLRARAEDKSPQEIVDVFHAQNKASFEKFGIEFDYYGRTSSGTHYQTSQDFFSHLAEKKIFILKSEKQLYDPEAKIFLADRFVKGTCPNPNCGYTEAYGDQCEKCGTSLSPTDLLNPRSVITDATPVLKESVHWYLPLENFQKNLEKWIGTHPEWKTNVLGQIRSWFEQGLKDRAVTRDLPWGVPVPESVAKKAGVDARGKVLYVWFDAPIGYISATKEWASLQGDPDKWRKYWQDEETRLVHFIGKDNIVFHCLIFPAMLSAHGNYILPDNVPANEFLNLEGNKLSTSRNYAVWLDDYLSKFEPDSLRYCLAANLPETKDSDFSWKDFQAKHNNELADILGNFVNRTITFAHKYFDGKIPRKSEFEIADLKLLRILEKAPHKIGKHIDQFELRKATRDIVDIARSANKYFNDKTPWEKIKIDPQSCATTIYLCLETVRSLAILAEPVIPYSTEKIWQILGIVPERNAEFWDSAGRLSLVEGQKLGPQIILFKKIEDEFIEQEIIRLEAAGARKNSENGDKEAGNISYELFKKIDLRIAEIKAAERIEKTEKLMRLKIELGSEQRQIIAGIASSYEPGDLIGRKIVLVANLEPAKIHGEISQGMLLAAKEGEKLSLLTISDEIHSGAKVS
jgi:methionyl-tRNA synthetase